MSWEEDEQLRDLWRQIACGENPQGDFLTHFARAVVNADLMNFQIIRPVALQLAAKYELEQRPRFGVRTGGPCRCGRGPTVVLKGAQPVCAPCSIEEHSAMLRQARFSERKVVS